jgi:hypothetical protein
MISSTNDFEHVSSDQAVAVTPCAGPIAASSSINAFRFSSARTFLRGPLRDQTHGEFVYRPFQFHKRSQLFISTHDEPHSLAMRINDPKCAPIIVKRRDPAHAESGFHHLVEDYLPVLHGCITPHPPRFAAFASFSRACRCARYSREFRPSGSGVRVP